jgi:acetate kinase
VTRVLAVNPGSSSLKLALVNASVVEQAETLPRWDGDPSPLARVIDVWGPDAISHRVVHGGERDAHEMIDDDCVTHLAGLVRLAPDHQRQALDAITITRRLRPDLPHVACYDTVFHRTIPEAAHTYAVPQSWRDLGVRRYGFHGLSHAASVRQVDEHLGVAAGRRHVGCHLGSGASLCAILDGRSVDTTMGMTPLDGLVMGTRPGSLDPGLVTWLIDAHGIPVEQIEETLNHHSGLLALGGDPNVAGLFDARDRDATLALDVYVHRIVTNIGAMTAAIGGLDILTFTGGIGEHVPEVRRRVGERLDHLNVRIDDQRNINATPPTAIHETTGAVPVLVLPAQEEAQIAYATDELLAGRVARG